MKRKNMLWLCTLLGFLGGVAVLWLVTASTESTLQTWIDDLFYQKLWESWVGLIIMLVVPTFVGMALGAIGEGFGSIFLTPFVSALAGFVGLLIQGLVMLFNSQPEIYGTVALLLIFACLIPPARTVLVTIISIRKR